MVEFVDLVERQGRAAFQNSFTRMSQRETAIMQCEK
jgi:hypothetical protein